MELTFKLIKKIISILSTGTILLAFLITIFITNKKSPNYIEYTNLSKLLLNLYTLILLVLIFTHSIYPKIICSVFTKRFGIISSEKGKIIMLSFIFIMYFGTGNRPQKIFGMIAFLATFGYFLSNLFLNCKNIRKNPFVEEKTINSKVITTTTENFNKAINNTN